MKIAQLAVKNPQFTLVVFAMVAALGVSSFLTIPRSEDPQFPLPVFFVVAAYPGATPTDVESLVAQPLEDKLAALADIKNMRTEIGDGLVVVRIDFDDKADPDDKHQEVQRQVEAARAQLPADLSVLEVEHYSITNVSLAQIALVSADVPYHVLVAQAERLEHRLESVAGVKEAKVWAYPERELRVALDIERLAQYGIPLDQVLQAMGSDNRTLPGGHVDMGGRKLNVEAAQRWRSEDDVRATVVAGGPAGSVHLGDVAEVGFAYTENRHLGRYRGERALFVTVVQKDGQNIFAVQEGVSAELSAFAAQLPPGVRLERGFDQSKNVARRLDRLYHDFGLAILLVLVTLLPLGLRASLVVMISIPLSLAIGLTGLHLLGYNLNQLSIVGFVIALGLLVDDSIVVVENISRFLREGYSRVEAAIQATRQIGTAVLGCTATLIFAFVPLLFLPGGAGDFVRSLPIAVVLTIVASLVVSLTIVPFLASTVLSAGADPHGNLFLRGLNRAIEWSYRPVLQRTLARPKTTLVLAGALFVASLALVPRVGVSLFPKAQTAQFIIRVNAPDGTSLAHTDEVVKFVEAKLATHPEVKWYMANVGNGNPQLYYNVAPTSESPSRGEVAVELAAYDPRTTPAFLDRLRAELAGRPDARIEVIEFANGLPVDAPIAIRILGDDLDVLASLARDVEAVLGDTPGTLYVDNPMRLRRTDLRVAIDKPRAGLLGVATAEIARSVRLGLAGLEVGSLRTQAGEDIDVSVTLAGAERSRLASLDRLVVPSVTGAYLPLAQVASLELTSSPTKIDRFNRQRAVTVKAHVQSGYNTDRVTQAVIARLGATPFPPGYRWQAAGEVEARQESFAGLGSAVIVAVFMVLAILVLEFKSFRGTIIVASVIPLGITGGIAMLYLAGETLSFIAAVGFIALIGIEIKSSILLVDFAERLRGEGLSLDDAVQRAGEIRFVPILLTSATAIGGLLPLALQGSALYSPLALVIIGGLITSTLLSRLVTPAVYKLLAPPAA